MGKAIGVVAVLALLVGAAGLGFGYYTLNKVNSTDPILTMYLLDQTILKKGIINTWYNFVEIDHAIGVTETWLTINYLTIDFNVNPGESVIFTFTGRCVLDPSMTVLTYMRFQFVLDGQRLDHPTTEIRGWSENGQDISFSVSLQTARSISSGKHSITIAMRSDRVNNYIDEFSLLVQTYVP